MAPPRPARQVLLLGIVLVLPVVAFLLLKTFGRNAWQLRTYLPERVVTRQVGAQAVSDTLYHQIEDGLELMTASGQTFNPARSLAGRVVVLAVKEGGCQEPACRAMVKGMGRVQERYKDEPAVKLLFVVPADSATGLAELAERAGAISGKWFFTSGPRPVVAALRAELRDTSTTVRAGNRLWLLDAARHVRGIYSGADPRDIERLLIEVDVLRAIERQQQSATQLVK